VQSKAWISVPFGLKATVQAAPRNVGHPALRVGIVVTFNFTLKEGLKNWS
jgi:hypothetical protein